MDCRTPHTPAPGVPVAAAAAAAPEQSPSRPPSRRLSVLQESSLIKGLCGRVSKSDGLNPRPEQALEVLSGTSFHHGGHPHVTIGRLQYVTGQVGVFSSGPASTVAQESRTCLPLTEPVEGKSALVLQTWPHKRSPHRIAYRPCASISCCGTTRWLSDCWTGALRPLTLAARGASRRTDRPPFVLRHPHTPCVGPQVQQTNSLPCTIAFSSPVSVSFRSDPHACYAVPSSEFPRLHTRSRHPVPASPTRDTYACSLSAQISSQSSSAFPKTILSVFFNNPGDRLVMPICFT